MMMMTQIEVDSGTDWERIVPLLDAELQALGDKDRTAVILRFFEAHKRTERTRGPGTQPLKNSFALFLIHFIFNHMVEYRSTVLDRTFGALADPTRRRI